jgi:toxin ParE1/3/4
MRVRYTERALDNLWSISRTIRLESLAGADAVAQRIERTVRLIAQHSGAGRVHRKNDGIRRLAIGRYPYTVYYRIDADVIVILHVRHAKRRAPKMGDLT